MCADRPQMLQAERKAEPNACKKAFGSAIAFYILSNIFKNEFFPNTVYP